MTKDTGCGLGLFGIEGGDEGEDINIEAGAGTKIESVKRAVDPANPLIARSMSSG